MGCVYGKQAMRDVGMDAARSGDGLGWRCGCEALSLACSVLSRHLGLPGTVQLSGWGVVVAACLGAVSTRGGGGAPPTAY
jgi:hypothetical protein